MGGCACSAGEDKRNWQAGLGQDLDPEVLALISRGLTSVWALEVLLLLLATPEREWHEAELVRELRASPMIVREAVAAMINIGVAAMTRRGTLTYAAPGPLDRTVRQLADAFKDRPVTVVRAIAEAPDERIKTFADAFRLRGKSS